VGQGEHRLSGRHDYRGEIPAVFADYATLLHPGEPDLPRDVEEEAQQDHALIALLQRHSWTPARATSSSGRHRRPSCTGAGTTCWCRPDLSRPRRGDPWTAATTGRARSYRSSCSP